MLPAKRVNLGKDHSHSAIHRRLLVNELMMVIFVLTTRSSKALALVIVISLLYFILHELMRHGR